MKELVDRVKYATGRSKVKIVATSMGGLVARRYIQLFGEASVEELVLVAVPNNGVSGNIARLCPVIGEALECRDMQEGSLFLNKLNRGSEPKLTVHNIIGVGCSMGGETGDGIVANSSAYLEFAENYYVEGQCTRLGTLHSSILDIAAYPKVGEIVLAVMAK